METRHQHNHPESHHSEHHHKEEICFFVDGEPFETVHKNWTPDAIIRKFGEKDPACNYLVRIEHRHRHSYEGLGEIPIELHQGERFQIVSIGPTPVS